MRSAASLRSLAYRTDVALAERAGGVVRARDRYLVLETPSNPDYRWGNLLLYRDPPREGDHDEWLADLARELPGSPHALFAWDRPDGARGEVAPFLADGFEEDVSVVLTAAPGALRRGPKHDDAIRVAPLATDAEWARAVDVEVAAFAPRRSGTMPELRAFVERHLLAHRGLAETTWFGAWVDGRMAGTLGLFAAGDLGRFQLVTVDPAYGRRGVCSTMVHEVARFAFDALGLGRLVMAADAAYHAARVYESVGFARAEHLHAVLRAPPAT